MQRTPGFSYPRTTASRKAPGPRPHGARQRGGTSAATALGAHTRRRPGPAALPPSRPRRTCGRRKGLERGAHGRGGAAPPWGGARARGAARREPGGRATC